MTDQSAASVIDRETWILLAERLDEITRENQEDRRTKPDDSVVLVFDKNDQAHVVPK